MVESKKMKILITGAAGFIGFHLARRFLERGAQVIGVDNLNDYYEVSLKKARLRELEPFSNFSFSRADVSNREEMEKLFSGHRYDRVIHMAAQAGVRYSIENPHVYVQSNLVGFANVLEECRRAKTPHLIYASSSSVYGTNTKMPFSVGDMTDHPASLYGATKKSNELMAHAYSHLYGIPTTGLRFFTVYGPWGRPDMALFKFTKAIIEGRPIDLYGEGRMKRDFTYIDDIVEGVMRVSDRIPNTQTLHAVYNIGNNNPIELSSFVSAIESVLGKKAKINFLPMQMGDVPATYADVSDLTRDVGFAPKTPVADGIQKFIDWYRSYYK